MCQSSEMVSIPGTLVEVLGHGVLLQGDSGCGKSDLALGLIDRGHQLVADDAVDLRVDANSDSDSSICLIGSCRDGFSGFIEIRGLGVVDVARLFGESAVSKSTTLDLVITLVDATKDRWQQTDRLSLQHRSWRLPAVSTQISVPEVVIPYTIGRDMPLLMETAVRIHACRDEGEMRADFESRLIDLLARGAA